MQIPYARPATASAKLRFIRWPIWVGIGIAVALFAVFIWPSPYFYDHQKAELLRVNRFTGEADTLTPNGWVRMQKQPAPPPGFTQDVQ